MVQRVTFVRHGESESNVVGRWQGQGDSVLSANGREQAQLLSARLAHTRFDRMLSSDLSRARDTGIAVSSRLGKTLVTDPIWREIDVGAWEGLTHDQVTARFPEEVEALARGEMIAIGGAESWLDLALRGRGALDALRVTMHEDEHVVVFSHGGVIASLVTQVFGLPLRRPRRLGNVNNTALTTLQFDREVVRLERYNDTLHLGALGKWGTGRQADGCTIVAMWQYDPPDRYKTPRVVHRLADLPVNVDTLDWLSEKHPGQRVGLVASADEITAITAAILAPDVAADPEGVTHLVASSRGHTVADLHMRPGGLTVRSVRSAN